MAESVNLDQKWFPLFVARIRAWANARPVGNPYDHRAFSQVNMNIRMSSLHGRWLSFDLDLDRATYLPKHVELEIFRNKNASSVQRGWTEKSTLSVSFGSEMLPHPDV